MRMQEQVLGYRELGVMAEFMLEIAWKGLGDDMPEIFSYDFMHDCAVCVTKKGLFITSDDEF